jgi:hypothetical protein
MLNVIYADCLLCLVLQMSVVMLNVVRLNVFILNVVAPKNEFKKFSCQFLP